MNNFVLDCILYVCIYIYLYTYRHTYAHTQTVLVFVQVMRGMEKYAHKLISAPQTMEAVTHQLLAPPAQVK